MTMVKICGLGKASDALAAAEAGADYIGLVFIPGRRRRVDDETAVRVVSALREGRESSPVVVGLFAGQPPDEVDRTVRRCGLDMVQLCGGESLDYCAQLEVPVIRVHHVGDGLPVEDAVAQLAREVLPFIERGHLANLDRKVGTQEGGTGQSFNWDISEGLAAQGLSFLMAGGLTPENVGRAVRKVRPWGVDVSSGVEIDGAKDAAKIKAFISAVRSAEG